MLSVTPPASRASGNAEPPQRRLVQALKRRLVAKREWPTSNELAKDAGLSRTMVRRLLVPMLAAGTVGMMDSTKEVPCQRIVLLVDEMPEAAL